jgi:hypothetical protein
MAVCIAALTINSAERTAAQEPLLPLPELGFCSNPETANAAT